MKRRRLEGRQGAMLALVPLAVAVLVGALTIPRAVQPGELPLPVIDAAAMNAGIARDHAAVEEASRVRLSAPVRALGTAIRAFNAAEVKDADGGLLNRLRAELNAAVPPATDASGIGALVQLRAVQMEGFLTEVRRFEETGARTRELEELGGTFVQSLIRVGWCRRTNGDFAMWPPPREPMTVVLDDWQRRAAFKLTWNKLVGLDEREELRLTLEESRALFTLYLRHPHAPESQHVALAAARQQARNAETCARIDDGERVAALGWALTKMKELSTVDPSYPLAYARGIALFHRHEYAAAEDAFSAWLLTHPNGQWTLRARNFLAASAQAANTL